jgi:hypothetical protein
MTNPASGKLPPGVGTPGFSVETAENGDEACRKF